MGRDLEVQSSVGQSSLLKQAFLAVQQMQSKLDHTLARNREPVAVIGMGCRLPGGVQSPDQFWDLLKAGRDVISQVPPDRWDIDRYFDVDPDAPGKMVSRWGGFLDQVDMFDPSFFNIAPREAAAMDPQQRLTLEVVWAAMEDAGCNPNKLNGTKTGVFLGMTSGDYGQLQLKSGDMSLLGAHYASGAAHSIGSGRISYLLGLTGPSITLDTACSSSLIAIHLACQSLRAGDSNVAIAGGVNVMLMPETTIALSHARMLAPDGRCKAFDAAADGFARGEGCAIVVLKRLSEALRDGDRIHAVIRGSAVNQDGASSSMTAPNGTAQVSLIKAALENAGLSAADVSYVEAHGTGTALGDPIELRALGEVYGVARQDKSELIVASVKTNIGHVEAAAGVTGLIKAVLSLQHREIPAHLHFHSPTPHVPWQQLNLKVPVELQPWPQGDGPRRAAVSAFGFSGTNAHVILEEGPGADDKAELRVGSRILAVSAKSEAALVKLVGLYHGHLAGSDSETSLINACYTSNVGRAHFRYRRAFVGSTREEVVQKLDSFLKVEQSPSEEPIVSSQVDPPRIGFMFTGQGSEYVGMGRELYECRGRFAGVLDRCEEILRDELDVPLLTVLFGPGGSQWKESRYVQPMLFALEYALSEQWRSWGIKLDLVVGHSLGEYVAACVAGVFSLEAGLTLVAARGRLMDGLKQNGSPEGGMLSVSAGVQRVGRELVDREHLVSIAADNGPESVVLSGELQALREIGDSFQRAGIRTKELDVTHAFHSPLLEPMLDEFRQYAARVHYEAPTIPIVSNVTGRLVREMGVFNAEYWVAHTRQTVRFREGLEATLGTGCTLFVEVGAKPHLTALARAADTEALFVPSLRLGHSASTEMMSGLKTLYEQGCEIDWDAVQSKQGVRVTLPAYPFERERYWFKTAKPVYETDLRGQSEGHPLLGRRIRSARKGKQFESILGPGITAFSYLRDHVVEDRPILPGAAFLEMALSASAQNELEGVRFHTPCVVTEARVMQVVLLDDLTGGEFEIFSTDAKEKTGEFDWTLHASGKYSGQVTPINGARITLAEVRTRVAEEISTEEFYKRFEKHGLKFGKRFKSISRVFVAQDEALVEFDQSADRITEASSYRIHPVALDGCFQAAAAALFKTEGIENRPYLPAMLKRLSLHGDVTGLAWAYAAVRKGDGRELLATIQGFNSDGVLILTALELMLHPRDEATGEAETDRTILSWMYRVDWVPVPSHTLLSEMAYPPVQPGIQQRLIELAISNDLATFARFQGALNSLCAAYIRQAFEDLHGCVEIESGLSIDEWVSKSDLLERHRKLMRRYFEVLVEEGYLSLIEGAYRVTERPLVDLDAEWKRMTLSYPFGVPELEWVRSMGLHLSELLRGDRDPLEVLFSTEGKSIARKIYQESPLARTFNTILSEVVGDIVRSYEGKDTVHILEVGAGSGATTTYVKRILEKQSHPATYRWTDISPTFVAAARRAFADCAFMEFAVLNIESPGAEHAPTAQLYDIVIAANVVHATTDIRETLLNLRRLLKPGGKLLLGEAVKGQAWYDLTVGFTDGWWRFQDYSLRPNYALIDRRQWEEVLIEAGFGQVGMIPNSDSAESELSEQVVIVGEVLRDTAVSSERPGARRIALIAGDSKTQPSCEELDALAGLLVREEIAYSSGALFMEDMAYATDIVWLTPLVEVQQNNLGSSDIMAAEERMLGGLLLLVQAILERSESTMPRLWVVTKGAQGDVCTEPQQACVWGFAETLQLEHPELRCCCIDLEPESGLHPEVLWKMLSLDAPPTRILSRGLEYFEPRLSPVASTELRRSDIRDIRQNRSLLIPVDGTLDGIRVVDSLRVEPGNNEVEIRVHVSALNFRDVLSALGVYKGVSNSSGGECAGVITRVGAHAGSWQTGDEVVAVASGAFSDFAIANARMVWRKPTKLGFESAATIPVAFLTASYALHQVGRIRAGDTVLIHSAAGGVGLAAVQVARNAGALVFVTAGTAEKRNYLEALGVEGVMDSRSVRFGEELLNFTSGRGVDLVLNSLTGAAIEVGLRSLAPGGRFIELGLADIWSQERVFELRADIEYHTINLMPNLMAADDSVVDMVSQMMLAADTGRIEPLPWKAFSMKVPGDAFRFMAQAKHIGKVLISAVASQQSNLIREDGSYLITGGFSGLGLCVAEWLGKRKAGRLLLLGRSEPNQQARKVIESIRANGSEVVLWQGDVSHKSDVAALIEAAGDRPLKGVFHCAGVLEDGVLLKQDWERFTRVLSPKVAGTWNLHLLTRELVLDHFVLFSSVASVLGSPGQGNHAAANAFLDSFAHYRHRLGLPAISMNWGAWSSTGAAVRYNVISRPGGSAVGSMTPEQGLRAMELLLGADMAQTMIVPLDRDQFRTYGKNTGNPKLAGLSPGLPNLKVGLSNVLFEAPPSNDLVAAVSTAPEKKQRFLLMQFLEDKVRTVLSLAAGHVVDPRRPLQELGLDSLLSIELRNILSAALGRKLPATLLFDYPTLDLLGDYLLSVLVPKASVPGAVSSDPSGLIIDIENMSDEEVERMFQERATGSGV